MKLKELREKSAEQLENQLQDTRQELMNLRFQQVTGQLTDTSRLRQLRRDIARLETLIKEFSRKPAQEGEA